MPRTELLNVFRATATEVAEKDFNHVVESAKIAELGIDSLGMLEIIGSLERSLKIQIPDESLAGVVTVEDLLNAVDSRQ
ncbi:MAG: acyl carrier protein [Labilithrix sp.]